MQIKTFEVVAPENIRVGKINEYIYTLMTSTKAKKFRAGFMKKNGEYRVGKFDLLNYFLYDNKDLSKAYVKKCEKFFKELKTKKENETKKSISIKTN